MAEDAAPKAAKAAPKKRRRTRRRWRRRRLKLVQLRDGPGLQVKSPWRAFGTKLTVSTLRDVMAQYHERFPDADPIWIHDLSKRRGGELEPHLSHKTGRDVDIRLVHKRPTKHYCKATPRTLNLEHTWFLIERLYASGAVEFMFLDRRLQRALHRYARRNGYTRQELRKILQFPGRWGSFVRHWKGHADHIHVRFLRRPRRPDVA
jgi:murein endopeptidase